MLFKKSVFLFTPLLLLVILVSCRLAQENSGVNSENTSEDQVDRSSLLKMNASTSGLDVCDVSFLFLPPKSFIKNTETDHLDSYISISDISKAGIKDVTGQPFEESVSSYIELIEKPRSQQIPSLDLTTGTLSSADGPAGIFTKISKNMSNWKLVGFRINPLSVSPADSSKRKLTLKLIFQPIAYEENNRPEVEDMTLHVSFDYKPEEITRIAKKLLVLKNASPVNTTGIGLGIHPAFEQEGIDGNFAKLVRQFLFEELQLGKFFGMATMFLTGPGEPWAFAIGVKTQVGWAFVKLPHIEGNISQSFTFSKPIVSDKDHNFEPLPIVANLSKLFPRNRASDQDIELIQKIDNPKITNVINGDCVSCHVTTQSLFVYKDDREGRFKFFDSPHRFPPPKNLTPYIRHQQHQKGEWNLRNFGFFGVHPSVSMRTVNESLEVANFINKEILNRPNPADFEHCDLSALIQCKLDLGGNSCKTSFCVKK